MEEFDKFIFQLFERFGYEFKCQLSKGQALYKHQQKSDYWIVAKGLNAMKYQYDLYTDLTDEHKDECPLADKNTSLLMLVDMESDRDLTEDEDLFVQMENEPLYFKKYVLPYTQAAFDELQEKMVQMKAESTEEIIMKDEVFEDLTQNKGYAKLLYTIIHKLPFIPIITDVAKELDNELKISLDVVPLAKSLDSFPEEEEQYDSFIEKLIKEHEDEGN